MDNIKKLNSIILKIFQVKESDISDAMSPETVSDWDSMNYLMFISEVEDVFNIRFTMDEVMDSKTLRDVKKYLKNKGVEL